MFLPSALSSQRPAQFRKLARRAAACKSLVLTDGYPSSGIRLIPFTDSGTLATVLSRLVSDDIARLGFAQQAWRDAIENHSIFERLETILHSVSVSPVYNAASQPSVNVVAATLRPQMIPHVLAMYRAQTYHNTSLTIVVNGGGIPNDMARRVHDTAGAKLCFVPADKTLGYCMNLGIDQVASDYWAKWDDDDVYGPNYLKDQLLQRKYVDFDIAGKATIFNYIEEQDRTYIRNVEGRDCFVPQVGGGTLLVKNDNRPFAEDGRGGEDRAFLHLARERGDRIYSGDPFSFLQVRRTDRASHTWALGAHAIDLSGPARRGLDFSGIVL